MYRKANTSIKSVLLAIRQLSCIIAYLENIQIDLNLCSLGLGRIHSFEVVF